MHSLLLVFDIHYIFRFIRSMLLFLIIKKKGRFIGDKIELFLQLFLPSRHATNIKAS